MIHYLFKLLGLVPTSWHAPIAGVMGGIWYAVDRGHRRVTLDNLSRVFPANGEHGVDTRRIARDAFNHILRIPFEIGWSLGLSIDEQLRHFRVRGMSHLYDAQAKGRGVLILTLHIGNWELLPTVFLPRGIRANVVYRPLDFKAADDFFLYYRRRFGVNPIPKKKSMRKMLSALKRKDCVGILLDQDSGRTAGVFADFLGQPACTNKGMALLAMKTRAPVLPVHLVRQDGKFEVHVGPEIPLCNTGQKEHDIKVNTENYNKALSDIIRGHPEQWLWMHKRWKTKL